MRDVAILSAVRTPIGRAPKGNLRQTRPDDLGALAAREALRRAEVDPAAVEDLVLGCANPEAEQGLNVARQVGFLAGMPDTTPAVTINRFCSSGLQAASIVADRIAVGGIDVGVAGGLESMSMIPMGGNKVSLNPRVVEEFPDAYIPMGNTAENVARKFNVSRGDQDAFAFASHQKATAAWARGDFAAEVVPVRTRVFDGDTWKEVTVDRDEGPRADTSLEKLASLKPVFDPTGTVTAGNSSPLNDGAAAVVLMGADEAKKAGKKIRAYFRAFAVAGVPPAIMGIGPVPAVRKLLAKTGLSVDQIDLYEVNEAFASQAVYCLRELGLPRDRVNVNGGAIALGHPLGCTGARQIATALHELERRKGRYAVITMCVGGGMGAAGLIERA
ncbi:MAG TPA: thiolase family protein [Polyangia bacterium]|jgi:acetyl-CoA acyltransferase|nr:thiolase family protein [Polyangia bacterium]